MMVIGRVGLLAKCDIVLGKASNTTKRIGKLGGGLFWAEWFFVKGYPLWRKKSAKQYLTASLRWGQGTGNWGTDDLYKPVYDEEDYMQVTFSNKKQHSVCLLRNKIDTSVNSR